MIKLVCLFERPERPEELEDYVRNVYLPAAVQFTGIEKIEITHNIVDPIAALTGGDPESFLFLQLEMYFKDIQSIKQTLDSKIGLEATKNIMDLYDGYITTVMGSPITYNKADIIELYNQAKLQKN